MKNSLMLCHAANIHCFVYFYVIELAITCSGKVCSGSHWGNEGQGLQNVSWHASLSLSLSNTNTQQILHLTRISTHYSYMHTISQASPNTHHPHLKAALQGYDYEGTGPLLFRAWKSSPQVRQVVYQVGCTVLKLRASDTGRGEGV